MSSNYIKVTVCPGLNLRPSISFVDRMRVEADGRQLTEDVERKLTMVLAKKVFAPQIEYIEWEMNRLAEMPYNIGTFYEAEEFFRRIIADYDASHKQTVEMELETLIRKEERRFPEMQDSGSAKIIPMKVKFRETRSRIGIFEYLKEAMRHVNRMLDIYKVVCGNSLDEAEQRHYRVIEALYLRDRPLSPAAVAEMESIDKRTVYKDVDAACATLSALIFGIDGIKKA